LSTATVGCGHYLLRRALATFDPQTTIERFTRAHTTMPLARLSPCGACELLPLSENGQVKGSWTPGRLAAARSVQQVGGVSIAGALSDTGRPAPPIGDVLAATQVQRPAPNRFRR
jgi:hypothetical protein